MADQYPKCARKNSRYHFNNVFLDEALRCDRFFLYQLGELHCNDLQVIEPHRQFCAEFTYVISGKGSCATDGVETPVEKGDCYLSFVGDVHGVKSRGDLALRYFFCGFNPADETSTELLEKLRLAMQEREIRSIRIPEMAPLFHGLMTEVQNTSTPYYCEVIGLTLYQMLVTVYRTLCKSGGALHEYRINDKSILAYKMMAYIDENLFSIRRLQELEEVFHFKYRHLEKCFLSITQTTISDYCKSARMQYAARELLRDASVTELSEKLGFSSIYAFSRAFSNFFGQSPSEYRRTNGPTSKA